MNKRMNKSLRIWLIIVTLIVVTILAILWATSTTWFSRPPFAPHPPETDIRGDIELFYTVETVVSTINATLSILLLLIYISIYQKTRSEFTVGLIIFSAVLLLHALVSIPLVFQAFGFYEFGLGPFAMLPSLFSLGALIVLLYLSVRY
jgi:hypothetical protein